MNTNSNAKKSIYDFCIITFTIVLFVCSFCYSQVDAAETDYCNSDTIVHITDTGSKYHREGCSYLKSDHAVTLYTAVIIRGLEPCSRCHPPILGHNSPYDDAPYYKSGTSYTDRSSNNDHSSSNSNSNHNTTDQNQPIEEDSGFHNSIKYVAIVVIVGIIVTNAGLSINTKRKEKELKARRDLEIAENKNKFLLELDGARLRDKAGVPENITLVNNLPIDNNDTKYGSFTLYISKNGTRYHERAGCSSAKIPIHRINAINHGYVQCSRCCRRQAIIPDWYNKYIDLYDTAVALGFAEDSWFFDTGLSLITDRKRR